jgi:hypothetical protein
MGYIPGLLVVNIFQVIERRFQVHLSLIHILSIISISELVGDWLCPLFDPRTFADDYCNGSDQWEVSYGNVGEVEFP